MYESFVKSPSTIILIVVQADVDFSTTEAVEIVEQADPMKQRTMAVVTKIDRCDDYKHKLDGDIEEYQLGLKL